jgi:hypothetical protein
MVKTPLSFQMYAVVEFLDDELDIPVEGVPMEWVSKDREFVWWPEHLKDKALTKAIEDRQPPALGWKFCKINFLQETGKGKDSSALPVEVMYMHLIKISHLAFL